VEVITKNEELLLLLDRMHNECDDVQRALARAELQERSVEFFNYLLDTDFHYPRTPDRTS